MSEYGRRDLGVAPRPAGHAQVGPQTHVGPAGHVPVGPGRQGEYPAPPGQHHEGGRTQTVYRTNQYGAPPQPPPDTAVPAASRRRKDESRWVPALMWTVSTGIALLLLLGVVGLWVLTVSSADRSEAIGQRVATDAETESYLKDNYPGDQPLLRVYTGLYVKSVEFTSANNVQLSGYVWQRYQEPLPKNVTPGVAFPEAEDSYSTVEVYRSSADGYLTIGWTFQLSTRQKFNYSRYPLDRQDVWLRMWHSDFDSGALLLPDLAGYPEWHDEKFLGVDRETVFDEWEPNYTFFSYNKIAYEASFGYGKFGKATGRPELYFNMGFKRSIYGGFLAHIIPIFFIAAMMFASLFSTTTDPERVEETGSNTLGFIGFCVAMLLVVVIQHGEIRAAVGGSALSYLDYLQFILYGVITLVTVNSILIRLVRPPRWITWRENLIPKVLYWPFFWGATLAVTVMSYT